MRVSVEKPGSPEELVHFGTKGMKWGTRKAYVSRQAATARMLRKKEAGTANFRERVATLGITKKRAGKIATKREAHVERMRKGKATTKDILMYYGGVSMVDTVRGMRAEPHPRAKRSKVFL